MESYRFKNLSPSLEKRKRLLLPLSGGVSSLCLLQVLDEQVREQKAKQGRVAYELVVVSVDPEVEWDSVEGEERVKWLECVKERFEIHKFLDVKKACEVLCLDDDLEDDLETLGFERTDEESDRDFYETILSSTKSVTTRTDLREILIKRLLVGLAKNHQCDSLLWGHSDTTLAAQTLADVAKGRGGSVPGSMSDGPSAEGINFNYPMRDLFKAELDLYASCLSPTLVPLKRVEEAEKITSIRNTSIDNLLNNYITSQGQKYPSIMANVVRTASKLQAPAVTESTILCAICHCTMAQETDERLCYGCIRMQQDIKTKS